MVLNPDIFFSSEVILNLIQVSLQEKQIALIAPKIISPDKKHQYSVRKYPKPKDLFIRRLGLFKKRILDHEYQNIDISTPFYPDCVSGCFMLFKTADFVALNGFDEQYFLYLEDFDLCKKIDALGKKKCYYPKEKVVHIGGFGSKKKLWLFYCHISSAIKYFLKWGI